MRALSVFLVIFNHLNINLFQGGFIGVDIFLVISGYLITKNIIKEQNETSSFSVKKFYEKRIIRLAPAFFTLIWSSLLVFSLVFTQDEWSQFLKSVISSTTLNSNIYFATQLNDYFSINAYSTPLLHIWSLSLEEQFYLIWPFVLLFIFKTKTKNYFLYFSIFIVSSLLFSELLSKDHPILAYYLLPSRIFEFCIGAIVALIPYYKVNKKYSYFAVLFSIFSILAASFLINKQTKFPTYNALLPCISAAIFIYFSQNIQKLKIATPFYYLGRISYPMYLWHWPIIVYLSLYSIKIIPIVCLGIITFTIALSAITHEFVEKKVKIISFESKNNIKNLFILPISITLAISLFLLNKPEEDIGQEIPNSTINTIKCVDQLQHPLEECMFGRLNNENIDILLVGDSHANSLSGFVDILAKDANMKGYEVTHSSTAFLLNTDRYSFNHATQKYEFIESFNYLNTFKKELIENNQFKFVVISGYFPENWLRHIYTTHKSNDIQPKKSLENFKIGFENSIQSIINTGATPIIINDTPLLSNVDTNCNLRNINPEEDCSFDKQVHIQHFKDWESELSNLKKRYSKLIIIDLNNIICNSKKCYSYINKIPIYRDNQHLSYEGSTKIGIEYLKINKNPLK